MAVNKARKANKQARAASYGAMYHKPLKASSMLNIVENKLTGAHHKKIYKEKVTKTYHMFSTL
jgi:hypothetical protein